MNIVLQNVVTVFVVDPNSVKSLNAVARNEKIVDIKWTAPQSGHDAFEICIISSTVQCKVRDSYRNSVAFRNRIPGTNYTVRVTVRFLGKNSTAKFFNVTTSKYIKFF